MLDKKGKKKSKKEFSDEYSLKNAFAKGDIFTRLSAVVMGLGSAAHGQIVKGCLFLATQIAYIVYMISVGGPALGKFFSLGGQAPIDWYDEAQGAYVPIVWDPKSGQWVFGTGDRTIKFLLFGVIAIAVTALFIVLWINNISCSYKAQCERAEGKRPATFKRDLKDLGDKNLHRVLLFLPITGVIAFTILPLIFMIFMAFTNYDYQHQNIFNWTGFQAFGKALNLKDTIGHDFWPVLGWTICWAIAATFSCYILGMILAIVINRKGTKCKSMWRFFFMISAAVPQFVSLLLMRTMFNQNGVMNTMLKDLGLISKAIPFWDNVFWARFLVIMINIWIGVPFTMLQVTGVLQNIPSDLYEAAKVDGAGPVKIFFKITLPYMLFVTAPYLITSFTGNINNFNVIFLLSGGAPARGYSADAPGKTDLLVTWLYKLTVSNKDKMYNMGAVIGIFTFIILATVSLLTYHRTGSYKNEEGFQ